MKFDRKAAMVATGAGLLLITLAVPSRREEAVAVVPAPAARLLESTGDSADGERDELLAAQARRSAELDWGPDPFLASIAARIVEPLVMPDGSAPRLTGISIRGADRRVVINRQVVSEGDTLASGYRVEEITNRSVTLRRDQEELTLILGEKK